jgi:hypothetical protein
MHFKLISGHHGRFPGGVFQPTERFEEALLREVGKKW